MSLSDWLKAQWLTEHKTSPEEIANLLAVADRDLRDCQAAGLSDDGRLAFGYRAAIQCALAALAACGYRPGREAHHYRVIQSLAHTIEMDTQLVAQLDAFRKKRNTGDYEIAGLITKKEADEMFILAQRLRKLVEDWLRKNHRELLPKH
jgi:HEPN domain-containing protein